jgi:hypothetical protein
MGRPGGWGPLTGSGGAPTRARARASAARAGQAGWVKWSTTRGHDNPCRMGLGGRGWLCVVGWAGEAGLGCTHPVGRPGRAVRKQAERPS